MSTVGTPPFCKNFAETKAGFSAMILQIAARDTTLGGKGDCPLFLGSFMVHFGNNM